MTIIQLKIINTLKINIQRENVKQMYTDKNNINPFDWSCDIKDKKNIEHYMNL